MTKTDRYLTPAEVSKTLGISVHALRHWRLERQGPRAVKFGKQWRYSEEELNAYIRSCNEAANPATTNP